MSVRRVVAVVLLALVCPLCAGALTRASAEPTELRAVRSAAPRPVPQLPPTTAADRSAPARGLWPLRPRPTVVAPFDPPASRWGRGHRGVDLAGRVGQEVRSALSGRVTFAGRLAGRGVVVVDHGGTRTTYEPVAASVAVGDRVAAGAVIGRLELFGSHCYPGACLHWGLIEGRETYLDPLTLVGAVPVVLLPLLTTSPTSSGGPAI